MQKYKDELLKKKIASMKQQDRIEYSLQHNSYLISFRTRTLFALITFISCFLFLFMSINYLSKSYILHLGGLSSLAESMMVIGVGSIIFSGCSFLMTIFCMYIIEKGIRIREQEQQDFINQHTK